jgi:hypothetical protein
MLAAKNNFVGIGTLARLPRLSVRPLAADATSTQWK